MKSTSSPFLSCILLLILPLSTLSQSDLNCNAHDKAILLKVKAHFGGVGLLSDWDPKDDCCDWDFIGCTGEESPNPGRVTALTISGGTGLKGTIPEEIGDLPFLNNVMFFDEPKLTGPIPQSFSKLTNLRVLTLNSNSLTGPIPAFLGQLKSLSQVDLSDNRFSGPLPGSLSGLARLSSFNVSHNMLTGSVPNLKARSLTSLDVSDNQLCGPIPAALEKFGAAAFEHNKLIKRLLSSYYKS
ncbi:hypothetical protein Cgig2_012132 [Carnegiea gigantea]|uniref:Leucine-rich repeat-containing N-terminal plant-type domain-containing protein n=1 Tax=Carnegiea gigantea TaxID=171969 RepID=A0A9Q1KT98_9CARY|nr:hypothetical protein Cgig2_012132 [Carnegiea gigantea]